MKGYILTVDTGGSKTDMTLFDAKGHKLASTHCVGLGTAYVEDTSLASLDEAIRTLPNEGIETVVINVGGTNTEQIRLAFAQRFPNAAVEAHRESSGVIMSALCDAEGVNALLMAGTGSIALVKGSKGNIITDGWCPNVGDLGSGYWIGLEAIRRSVIALEGSEPLSPLAKSITGLEQPFSAFEDTTRQMEFRDRVRSHFMPLERARVAGLTPTAADCAAAGDEMALNIFLDAGRHLAETVIRGLHIADAPQDTNLLLSGGLIHCFDLWGGTFDATLKRASAHATYRIGEATMTRGALYYALHHMKRRI